ncbi:MAG TPA: cupin domain-containing protein [Beijerinckiaceae bacterium]|jgi:quercetin dioxygenase-like cupin family protein
MLTRRGFASCAICAITGFVASEVSAQGSPPAAGTPGVTRKILSQSDGPAPGFVTLLVEAEIEAGTAVGRHTHPGIESAYVLEGGFELPVEGQPTRMLKAGDAVQVPPNTPHAGGKAGTAKTKLIITYVVEKGKPLASPA